MQALLQRTLPFLSLLIYGVAVSYGTYVGGAYGPVGIAGALLAALGAGLVGGQLPWPDRMQAFFVAGFLIIVAALNLQSEYPAVSWQKLLQQASIIVPLCLFSSAPVQEHIHHPQNFNLIAALAALTALGVAVDTAFGAPFLAWTRGHHTDPAEYNRGVCFLFILALPLTAYLWNIGRKHALLFLLGLAPLMLMTPSRTAKLVIAIGLGVTLAAHHFPRAVRIILAVLLVLSIGLPFAARDFYRNHHDEVLKLPPSWQARIEIWDYASSRIEAKPILGQGFYTSQLITFEGPEAATYRITKKPVSHLHNGMLQLWVELGIPGLVLGLFFALLMLGRAAKLPPRLIPFATGAWAACFMMSLTEFRLWDDSVLAAFVLAALCFALQKRASRSA